MMTSLGTSDIIKTCRRPQSFIAISLKLFILNHRHHSYTIGLIGIMDFLKKITRKYGHFINQPRYAILRMNQYSKIKKGLIIKAFDQNSVSSGYRNDPVSIKGNMHQLLRSIKRVYLRCKGSKFCPKKNGFIMYGGIVPKTLKYNTLIIHINQNLNKPSSNRHWREIVSWFLYYMQYKIIFNQKYKTSEQFSSYFYLA